MVGFYIYLSTIASIATIISIKQGMNWRARSNHSTKIPRGPLSSFVFSLLQFVMMILSGMNIINFSNGISFSLVSMIFLSFAYSYTVGLIRVVSLGEKIIPKARRQDTEAFRNLRNFDGLGRFMLICQVIFLLASSIVLIILSPVFPEHVEVIARVGWGCKSAFLLCCQCGYWYQFERCIRTIKSVTDNSAAIRANDFEKKLRDAEFMSAIIKMRKNQAIHVFAFSATILFFLLAAGFINGTVWIVYLSTVGQAMASFYFEFILNAARRPRMEDKVTGVSSKQITPVVHTS